ncbi:MAG: YciI family protein [gamma proteobacterium symbiont of Phacoides pectinatus]
MLYAIMGTDRENSLESRLKVREQHLERVNALQAEGRLIIAGPHPAIDSNDPGEAGFSGSLIIAEFETLDEASAWANDDPYATTDVFESVVVKPFKRVLP